MKISEFAELNNVTTKMLRHYDEIGLFKPREIDAATGYRTYAAEQSNHINWIIILKNIDFSLNEIKDMLNGSLDTDKIIHDLINKRIEITSSMNEQIQKKIEIDKLIKILERDGFIMDRKIDLLSINPESVHEIKKNIPNLEMFMETASSINSLCSENDKIAIFRLDISHFKQVNDNFGFDVGDNVIVACYNIINNCINNTLIHSTLGRAHGDEFIVFAKANLNKIEKIAEEIIAEMQTFDFSSIGCDLQMGCYIGGLVSTSGSLSDIRMMIEGSIDMIEQARSKGKNSFVVRDL